MFTLKFYKSTGQQESGKPFDMQVSQRIVIRHADSITVLRDNAGAEITMHRKTGDDDRLYVGSPSLDHKQEMHSCFDRIVIENSYGKTTEIISY